MKKNLLFFILFVLCVGLYAQTDVSGIQSGVWAKASSPYNVTDTIIVPAGDTLTIEAGVTVNFQGHYKFYVYGTIMALGTETDSIIFTAENHTEGWFGVRIDTASTLSNFRYCKFEYGITEGDNFPDQHGGAVCLNVSDAVFEHCVFENNQAFGSDNGMGGAVYGLNTGNSHFSNCIFRNNSGYAEGGGVKLSGDTGSIFDSCEFIGNSILYGGGGVCLYGCNNTRFFRNLFVDNYTQYFAGGAVLVETNCQQIQFVNCTMYGNQALGGDGGGVEIAYSDASFTNCIVQNNTGAYSDNIYLDYGYAEINYCNTPVPDDATGSNNINTDAFFVDADNGDFHLAENSPCIDAGIDSLEITDAYNNQILVIDLDTNEYAGIMPDMGCFEFDTTHTENIASYENEKITIYPNPAIDYIKISSDKNIESIELLDINGKVLIKKQGNQIINIRGLKSGVYILKIQAGNKFVLKKIIKF